MHIHSRGVGQTSAAPRGWTAPFSNQYHCVSLISYTEQAVPVDRAAMDVAHYNFYRTDSVDL